MKNLKKIMALASCCALSQLMPAQTHTLDTSFTVINRSDYNVVINDALKLRDNPVNDDSTRVIPVLKYGINSIRANTVYTPEPLEAPHMSGDPLPRLYKLYARGGFGNYTTSYGEVFFNSLRSREMAYGVHAKHLSSIATIKDKGFSGYSDNELDLYGKKFIRKHTLSGNFDYLRNVVHCYGVDSVERLVNIENDFTKNIFSTISVGAGLQSHLHDSAGINHSVSARYINFFDNHSSVENNIFAGADLYTYYLGQRIGLETSVDYYNNRLAFDTVNDAIVRFAPSFRWAGKKFNLTMGIDVTADVAVRTRFHFYPKFEVNYDIIDQIIIPYAGARGGLIHNSYRSFASENPFLEPTLDFRNTDKRIEGYAGLRGSISSSMNYNMWGSFARVNDQYFYINDFSEALRNRFKVVYDSVKVLNLHGELGFRKREKINFLFKGDYFRYYMKNEAHAWHRPGMQLTFTLNYNLKDKILAHADVFVIGEQLANRDPQSSVPQDFVVLKGYPDINLGLEYRVNSRLSGFANFNNLAGAHNQRWQNYPTQRFNFLAGLTYAL
jgi:hypothetical protein